MYNSVSWVTYQYYWSIYPDTSKSVLMITLQPWPPSRAAITAIFYSLWYDPAGDQTRDRIPIWKVQWQLNVILHVRSIYKSNYFTMAMILVRKWTRAPQSKHQGLPIFCLIKKRGITEYLSKLELCDLV